MVVNFDPLCLVMGMFTPSHMPLPAPHRSICEEFCSLPFKVYKVGKRENNWLYAVEWFDAIAFYMFLNDSLALESEKTSDISVMSPCN
jgi:hypothetical protein